MVKKQDKKIYKSSDINYFKEEEEILIGQWEDNMLFKSEMIGQLTENIQKKTLQNKQTKLKTETFKTKSAQLSNIFKKKVFKSQKNQRNSSEFKDETNIESVYRFDTMKSQFLDSDAGSEYNFQKYKSLEKKSPLLPNSPKDLLMSQSLDQNTFTQRSKFQKFQGLNLKKVSESIYQDEPIKTRKRNTSQILQTPLPFIKTSFTNQSQQDYEKDLTPFISPLVLLNLQQKEPMIENSQNSNQTATNQNNNKTQKSFQLSQQSNNNLLGVNMTVPLNQSSTIQNTSSINSSNKHLLYQNLSYGNDGMDKKSLSMRSRLLSINRRKQMSPEEQLFGAIKDGLFTEFEDIFQKYNQIKINQTDEEGNTFLIIASRVGNIDMVKELTLKGININHQNDHGNTALHMALAYGNSEVADYLLSCKVDQGLLNSNGLSAWDLAITQ